MAFFLDNGNETIILKRRENMKIKTFLMVLLVFITIIMNCCLRSRQKENDHTVTITGTVKFIGIEGGFYGILGDDGQQYDPTNMTQDFQVDDLRVRFKAKIRNDIATFHMWGISVEIIDIEKLN